MHTPSLIKLSVLAAAAAAALALPSPAAAGSGSCSDASLDESTLAATTSRPTISGEVSGAKSVQVVLRRAGSERTLYRSKVTRVRDGEWSLRVPKKLADGTYDVEVYCPKVRRGRSVAEGELVVGGATSSAPTVSVTPIALLAGGTAQGGGSIPVAYLKVTNAGKAPARLTGFKMKQNGTAEAGVVESLTVVDGTGTSRVTTDADWEGGVALAKTDVAVPAGEFKLFTVKANLAGSLGGNAGKSLKIDVASAEGAARFSAKFPIRGVTWTLR